MLRRKVLFLSLSVIGTFILTTLFLFNTINVESEVREGPSKDEIEILRHFKNLPDIYKIRPISDENSSDIFIRNLKNEENVELERLWLDVNSGISSNKLTDFSSPKLGQVAYALKHAEIIKADVDSRGTQLKLLLTLKGNQLAVFKPQWYDKEKVIEGSVYAGKDRYNSEIVGFYLSAILNKPLTAISVERELSLRHDILPVATKRLLNTTFERLNETCVYGKCFYCKKEDPICDLKGRLKGAIIYNVKASIKSHRSPWQRTYHKGKRAAWEVNRDYCKIVKTKLSKKRLYDLVDVAIFDFLLQNGDRHHYETIEDNVVFLDNGKGLGNPYIHHLDILAPLYQCCLLRRETWKVLLNLTGGKLKEKLLSMPSIENLITEPHLNAIEERLLLVFSAIQYCIEKKQKLRETIYQ